MHDHHGNLIDFHTQLSTVVEATEFGPGGSRSQTEVAMKFWTLKAMMIVGCAKRSRARPHICRRDESQCRFGDTAQAADNWDKFRLKPTGNDNDREIVRCAWWWGNHAS